MKKIISLIIAAAMLVLLVSCETNTDPSKTTESTPVATTANRPSAGEPVIEETTLKSAVGLADENGAFAVPDGITFIAEGAFANDEKLVSVTIPDSVTDIGSGAFYGCTSLLSITIPDSVTSLGSMAFYGCVSLESVKLSENITTLYPETFYYCQSLESIDLPEKLTSVGPSCFYGCIALSEVVFPMGLEAIGSNCFSGCISLRELTGLQNTKIESVSDMVFASCSALLRISLPLNVKSIGSGAFYGCTNLVEINIPLSVTEVGMMALSFTPWYRENTETFLIVGDGVLIKSNFNPNSADEPGTLDLSGLEIKSIGNSCFANVAAAQYSSAYGYKYHSNIKKVIIPEGVISIGSGAFYGCANIESVTLPSTLETIGGSAFYGFTTDGTFSDLTVSFANCKSLKTINDEAFFGCYGIEMLDIPSSVRYIGLNAFTETAAYYDFIDSSRDIGDGENKFKIVGDGVLLWVYVAKDQTSVVVPDGVKTVAGGACSGWDSPVVYSDIENSDNSEAIKVKYRITYNITSVTIPEGVERIGSNAFYRLIALPSIEIPDSVAVIDTSAFYQCGTIESIRLGKGLKSLGSYAFAVTSIKNVTLPEGLENIDSGAFAQCEALERLVIPRSVGSIGAAIIDDGCTAFSALYISPLFRAQIFTIADAQNPGLKVYYYNE